MPNLVYFDYTVWLGKLGEARKSEDVLFCMLRESSSYTDCICNGLS